MQGLYHYTLRISYKFYKLLSVLNKLTLQKDMQNVVTNCVFIDKKLKHNNNNKIENQT